MMERRKERRGERKEGRREGGDGGKGKRYKGMEGRKQE